MPDDSEFCSKCKCDAICFNEGCVRARSVVAKARPTVLTDERTKPYWIAGFTGQEICPTTRGSALAAYEEGIKAREVAAQSGQVAVPERDMKIAVAVAEDVFRKYGYVLNNVRLAEIINEVSPAKESK